MHPTVNYSPQKLAIMALVCAVGLPLLSPVMLLTGPGAIVLIPLLVFGGPITAIPCVIRAVGDRRAVEVRGQDVTIRTLWRTFDVARRELVGVRIEEDTLRWWMIVPIARKRHLVLDLGDGGRIHQSVRLPMNLLELDDAQAAQFAQRVRRADGR